MENILLSFCRDAQGHTAESIAAHLGISADEYHEIETGKILLTIKQSRQLEKLFNVKAEYFYEAALQLDLLWAKTEIIKIQKEKIEELKKEILSLALLRPSVT